MSDTLRSPLGTSATFSPIVKRAVGRHPDGRTLVMVVDTNRSGALGGDGTGVAKIYIYASSNSNRNAWSLLITHTPAVSAASATKRFVGSMCVGQDGDIYVAYQGSDNSLRYFKYNWNGSSYDAVVNQTVVSGNSVTNRYRSIDIDVQWNGSASSNPVIGVYEANASTGVGASYRLYIQLNDGTTWRRAWSDTGITTQTISSPGEDVSVCWGRDGIVTNVGRVAFFYTRSFAATDMGDALREISFDVNSGAADSGSLVGTWYAGLNAGVGAAKRRGFLFGYPNVGGTACWVFGTVAGANTPVFEVSKIHHNTFTGIVRNKTTVAPADAKAAYFGIYHMFYQGIVCNANYSDGVFEFVFGGNGVRTTFSARGVVFRFPSTESDSTAQIDSYSRSIDQDRTIAANRVCYYVAGGANGLTDSGLREFTTVMVYGENNDNVSSTTHECRVDIEESISLPTILAPNGTTSATNRPTFRFSVTNALLFSDPQAVVQFQIASNSGFSSNLQTITFPDPYLSYSSTNGTSIPTRVSEYTLSASEALFTGTWYLRARLVRDLGVPSAWTSPVSFTVAHPPAAVPSLPAEGTSFAFGTGDITFSWNFTDPEAGDSQSAYQVLIVDATTGSTIADSGKVTSSTSSHTETISGTYKDVPLIWSVRLWDADDAVGAYSSPIHFTITDGPTVSIASPTDGETVTTGLPTVSWTFATGGVRTQKAFRVRVYNTDDTPDSLAADSGWVFSTSTSYTFSSSQLLNAVNYEVFVDVSDSMGLQQTSDGVAFDTAWTAPALGDLSVTTNYYRAALTWTNANQDIDFSAWRVYRKYNKAASVDLDVENTADTWVLLAEYTDPDASFTYYDYTLPLNKAVSYLIVQLVDRFGSPVESDLAAGTTVTIEGNRYYFVPEIPIGSIASFEAAGVTEDNFALDVEQAELHVIGRGRQIQYGDELGYNGTLTIKLRNPTTARLEREFFQHLSKSGSGKVYIRSPFGDVTFAAIKPVSFNRMAGVGTADLGDLSVPYLQVFEEDRITRTV